MSKINIVAQSVLIGNRTGDLRLRLACDTNCTNRLAERFGGAEKGRIFTLFKLQVTVIESRGILIPGKLLNSILYTT